MKNIIKIISFVLVVLILSAGVFSIFYMLYKPEKLIDTDTLSVVRDGKQIAVNDLVGNEQYKFTYKRVRKCASSDELKTAVNTDSIKIDIIPHGGIRIEDKNCGQVYSITLKRWC